MKNDHNASLYTRLIRWSDEDECYIGSLPEICGNCCHGDTMDDVCKQLEEIAQEWVELAEQGKVTLSPPGSATCVAPSRYNDSATAPNAITSLRKNINVSQTAFATLLGVSRSTVAQWEQGRRNPDGAAARLLQIVEKHPKVLTELI